MSSDEDEPVAGSLNESDGMDAAMSPPERHAKLSRNRSMLAVIVICVICVIVVAVALATR
jgi:hypothetical protein